MLTGGKITYFLNGSKNPQTNLLTMTQSGSNVLLSGLAPGAVSAASLDGINGSQLYGMAASVAKDLGAGAGVAANGAVTAPSYVISGSTYNDVGSALDALGNGSATDAVQYDTSAHDSVTLGGVGSTVPVALHNVANGELSASSLDAVNGQQLFQTNQNVSNLTGAVTSIAGDITNINSTLADAVLYDSSAHDTVTLGGTGASAAVKLANVANGALAASSTDAVNGSQLYALGATTDGSGNITNAFVTYDDTSKGSVTLGGVGSSAPVKLTNVAAGDISSASSTDAVNGGQLYTTNQNVSNLAGAVTNIAGDITNINGTLADAVLYDSSAHDTVTLGGTGASAAVKLTNVANGALAASSTDAVNGSQLYALGATTDGSGNITNAFVTYDDTSKGSVTLGGVGSSAPVALHNVAAGAAPTDAVNVAQMNQAVITGNPYIGGQGSGVAAQATAVGAVALGLGSVANTAYTISVGDSSTNLTRRITNVATGVAGTDAVNVNQLDSAMGGVSATALEAVNNLQSSTQTALRAVNNQLGALSAVSATGVSDSSDPWVQVAGPADGSQPAYATPLTGSLAIGQKATATVGAGVAIGADALSTGTGAVAIGSDATASNNGSFAMGTSATASGNQANALGYGAVALGDNSTAIGQANALALNAFAVGYNSSAAAANSMAIGLNTAVSSQATNSIALGSKAKVTSAAPNSVALGASSVADRANTVSVGSGSQQRQIIYVAAGTASTDAVNVSQLTSAVSVFGANASVGADGSITGPSYVIGSQTYNNVGDALNALEVGGNGDPLAVHYDDTSMSTVTLGGAGTTTPVVLTNVANGGVSASSVDAVNGAQLYALGATTDASGNITNAFVAYDNTSMNSVTLGGSMDHAPVQLHNVAAGVVSSSSFDAVNGTQLYGLASSTAAALGGSTVVNPNGSISAPSYDLSGTTYNDVGSALSAVMEAAKGGGADAVVYDTSMHDKITLGGIKATNGPVQLTNVANGALNASSTDAVNGAQLYALGATTDSSGNVTNAFVAYDDTSKTRITLGAQGTTTPTALTNVANGQLNASSTDAVNGQQLFATNQSISDLSGAVTNIAGDVTNLYGKVADAVLYDSSAHDSVTFGNAGSPVALHNVANGVVSQASYDAVNGSQLYGLASSAASALGGKTTVNPNGTITAPTYVVQGSSYNDVGSALDAIAAVAGGGSVDAVMYDTSAHDKITLGGQNSTVGPVLLTNLSNGALSASSSDAVNGAQLYALGATTDSSGNITNAFVAYDDTSKSSVTFGGAGATSGVVLHNVAAGAQDLDAVNVAQLKAAGLNVDTSGNVLNAFVAYDDTSKSSITLGGIGSTTPVALHNVANGVTANDAVNVAQLEAMGANVDSSGNVTNSFVAYDDSTKSSVTFGGLGATTPVTLHNVGAGLVAASSTDAVNGAQLYNVASSTASSLGGGSTVQADGSISAPSYSIGGNTYNNVGGALTNLDGRVTNIENTVTNIAGSVANAVQYDSSAHDKITLGGTDASTAVALTNVANGALNASSTDAVNGSQLYATNVQVSNLNQAIQNINITGSEYMSTNTSSGAASATGANSIAAGGGAIASGANSTAMGDKASATGNNSVALGANSVANEDNTVSVGSQGNERRITNVANGINPTDAANVGQLQSGLNALQGNVNSVARNAYGGVAAATALTMIPDVDQNKTIAVGVGTANFQGYQAVALGASARITQNLKVKLGGGYASGGGATYGGGMSYQW